MLALNFAVPSLLNFYWRSPEPIHWERFLRYIIRLHGEMVGPFTKRPVTTALLHQANLLFHDAWISFLLVQGSLLGAGAMVLGILNEEGRGDRAAPLAQAIYFLSFTVLFSFVTPNDAFDEPAQYLFLFLSLYFLRRGQAIGFGCAFLLACLSRETSLLLLPGLWLLDPSPARPARKIAKYLAPLGAWAAFYFWKEAAGDPRRYLYWQKNFDGLKTSYETLISFALALGLPAAIFFAAKPDPNDRPWARAFFLTLFINTPIVLFAAYARESRLFALPLVFLWPRVGRAAASALRDWRPPSLAKASAVLALGILVWATYQPVYRHVLGYRIYASLLPALLGLGFRGRNRT